MKGRLLYQSTRLDTYVNLIVAMCHKYEDIKEISISFMNKPINEAFIDTLQKELTSYHNTKLYKQAARIHLSAESIDSRDINFYKGWDIIDVSAISKEIAIDVIALNLENPKVEVCTLQYTRNFKAGEKWILTIGNHNYRNLLSEGSLSMLYRNYFQKKVIIRMFGFMFGILMILSIIKFIIPTFIIPEDVISFFSLIIGAGGLYLAGISLEEKK